MIEDCTNCRVESSASLTNLTGRCHDSSWPAWPRTGSVGDCKSMKEGSLSWWYYFGGVSLTISGR